jgi:hypothetical protein
LRDEVIVRNGKEKTMKSPVQRLLFAAAFGVLLATARPALAQGKPKDDVKKLEAELAKLRGHLEALQARLTKAKEARAKKESGKKGPFAAKEAGRKGKHGAHKGRDHKGQHGFHKWAHRGWGAWWRAGRFGRRPDAAPKSSSVEQRLERLQRDLEALRRELKKK